mgnify:FL=1
MLEAKIEELTDAINALAALIRNPDLPIKNQAPADQEPEPEVIDHEYVYCAALRKAEDSPQIGAKIAGLVQSYGSERINDVKLDDLPQLLEDIRSL